jgi:hypothetical protein
MELITFVGGEGVEAEASGLLGEAWLWGLWGVLARLSVAFRETGGDVCTTAKHTANKTVFMIQ